MFTINLVDLAAGLTFLYVGAWLVTFILSDIADRRRDKIIRARAIDGVISYGRGVNYETMRQ